MSVERVSGLHDYFFAWVCFYDRRYIRGPAVVAFNVLKAVAKKYDGSVKLYTTTVEVIFDTSEETDMAMPHYLQSVPGETPDFGIIFELSK